MQVNFNANVTLGCEPPNPSVTIGPNGFISGSGGILLHDSQGRLLANGQTAGEGPIFVDGLSGTSTSSHMNIEAIGGSTSGESLIDYAGAPGTVTILNQSNSDLVINSLSPFAVNDPPSITQNAQHENDKWHYKVQSSNSTESAFNITNDSAADTDIIIAGAIENPAGAVNIRNIGGGGGDILGGGVNSWINSRSVFLQADSGFVGTANNRINLRVPVSADFQGTSGITGALGNQGVYLDINWGGHEISSGAILLDNIASAVGSVDLRVHDALSTHTEHGGPQRRGEDRGLPGLLLHDHAYHDRPRHDAAQGPGPGDARQHLGWTGHQSSSSATRATGRTSRPMSRSRATCTRAARPRCS